MHTTIKVSSELRDRLKAQASAHGRTIGQQIAALVDAADREARFIRLRQQVAETPPESMASYQGETESWAATDTDGLPAEDFSDWPGFATT